jgi:hypothetical protein
MSPGRVILTVDTNERYLQLREGRGGYVFCGDAPMRSRPELKLLREVHGDLDSICREIHGAGNPRIVVESKSKRHYQVVYRWGDQEALRFLARPLALEVTREERAIQAITIRVSPEGHRLKTPTVQRLKNRIEAIGSRRQPNSHWRNERLKPTKVEDICCDWEGRWPLESVTADELARFLESRYRVPVVNLTSLKGSWSILLSDKAGRIGPSMGETLALDDLGLELTWETVRIPVTVVKDKEPIKGGLLRPGVYSPLASLLSPLTGVQSRTVPSPLADANNRPSGEKASPQIGPR